MAQFDFNKSIFENRMAKDAPLVAAHRGVCGANVPCNSMAAMQIAINHGADIIELDVSKSRDGKYYVFHPGTEPIFLNCGKYLSEMDSEDIDKLYLLNQDKAPTSYKIPKLSEAFAFLKDKVYINVDKYWTDVEGITNEIRKAGVEKQVIVKCGYSEGAVAAIKKCAADFMFIPIIVGKDTVTDKILAEGINMIGAEIIFRTDDDEIISDEYVKSMHGRKMLLWANSIIFDEREVLSAHHSDDVALTVSPDLGWGWLIDKKMDFIQTDWTLALNSYMNSRNK